MNSKIDQKPTIVVGLSGGVDSAVTAALLREQGHNIAAIFMQNWDSDDPHCQANQDLSDAKASAIQLDISLQTVNFSNEYWDNVFSHCLNEFAAGRTPNPDVLCNREIKFKPLLETALSMGANKIATGHYARIRETENGFELHKGFDEKKDQSYFLYLLDQNQLSHALFPLGEITKEEVRKKAESIGLMNAKKKDSTGICFVGERKFKPFLQEFLLAKPGEIRSDTDELLGKHDGVIFYTIGQRQGLQIGGQKTGNGDPWYVIDKDCNSNTLIVGQGSNHPRLLKSSCKIIDCHWIAGESPAESFDAQGKLRHQQPDQACHISCQGNTATVIFDQPQRAITPGQSLVLYQDTQCLGGGIVCHD